jgi:glycosyltransferase involved in cell wall biosynthesis
MTAADVFVLPSRAEPLGVVLLEAMACGTPCVASRVGGIPEIVDVPANGRLVDPDDAQSLAGAMEDVLAAGRHSFVDACLATSARSDLDVNTARVVEVLARAAGGEGSAT